MTRSRRRGRGGGTSTSTADVLASFVSITWDLVRQVGQATRDDALLDAVDACRPETTDQIAFLRTRLEQAAPQALARA